MPCKSLTKLVVCLQLGKRVLDKSKDGIGLAGNSVDSAKPMKRGRWYLKGDKRVQKDENNSTSTSSWDQAETVSTIKHQIFSRLLNSMSKSKKI